MYVLGKLVLLIMLRVIIGLFEIFVLFFLGYELSLFGDVSFYVGYVLILLFCFFNVGEEICMCLFYLNVLIRMGRVFVLEYLW